MLSSLGIYQVANQKPVLGVILQIMLRAQYSIWSRTIDFERRATHMRTLSDKLFTEVIKLYQ